LHDNISFRSRLRADIGRSAGWDCLGSLVEPVPPWHRLDVGCDRPDAAVTTPWQNSAGYLYNTSGPAATDKIQKKVSQSRGRDT
jgi:hypothetical protein